MSSHCYALLCSLALVALSPGLTGVGTAAEPASTAPGPARSASAATPGAAPAAHGCLPTGNGYLRARMRGALDLDIDWSNAEIECDGGPRPDGSGVRLSFAGPPHGDGRRMRLVFGVGSVREGRAGHDLPTNLTVIFEGEERLFATRGADHCTVDELRQERVGALGGPKRSWRIIARGFCIAPASTLNGDARILINRFDFAGNAVFADED